MKRSKPVGLEGLVHRAGRGDEAAFADVFEQLSPTVFGMILHVVGDRMVAEQIAQSAFVEMWRQSSRIETGDARLWAATIAHRLASDHVGPAAPAV